MQKLLKSYLKKLTNLSSRNRSLLLLNLPSRHFIDIQELDYAIDKSAFELITEVLEQKNKIKLLKVLDPRDQRNNKLSSQLNAIFTTQNTINEERGSKDLYVGYPFVKGKFMDGTLLRAPLVFFPYKLIKTENHWQLEKTDAEPSFNRSLLLALVHFNKTSISDELLDFSFEAFPKDSLEFRTKLYETLKEFGLDINFNQETFSNTLKYFEKYTKIDLEKLEKLGELKIQAQAVLGIFPQGGSYLVNDYESIIETTTIQETTEHFFGKQINESLNSQEVDSILPLEIDASQESAIKKIKLGNSIVVQGPPGTGKSQLISNLISDYIANGKKVLMVCQKRAALDTVFNRLKSINLDKSVALIHDFKSDRKDLFAKISNQIDSIEDQKALKNSLNAHLIYREFTQNARKIDTIQSDLDKLKIALFDTSFVGKSIKELYLLASKIEDKSSIEITNDIFLNFKFDEFESFIRKYELWNLYVTKLQKPILGDWAHRKSLAKLGLQDKERHIDYFKSLINQANKYADLQTKYGLDKDLTITLNPSKDFITKENLKKLKDPEIEKWFAKFKQSNEVRISEEKLNQYEQQIQDVLINIRPDYTWNFEKNSATYREILETIDKHEFKSFPNFKYNVKKTLGIVKLDLNRILIENKLEINLNGIQALRDLCATKIATFEILSDSFFEPSTIPINSYLNSKTDQIWTNKLLNFLETVSTIKTFSLSEIMHYYSQKIKILEDAKSILYNIDILKINDLSLTNLEDTLKYFESNFDLLQAADQEFDDFNETEKKLCKCAKSKDQLLYNYYLAWIQRIETLEPSLKWVSTGKIEQIESELQECITKKQELSKDIVKLKLYEIATDKLETNRLKNRITYRGLYHQTTKKKRLLSIRQLIQTHQEEIFKLIPCWLASPEAVSAIFSIHQKFDLVIFDEASQCYAEHAIPALFRANQIVVAGDSKQLSPNDLYQIRYEEENYEDELHEIDSFLDLCTHYYPNHQLTGHYRSNHPALIEFSNQNFYKNSLFTLPVFEHINSTYKSIEFVKVEGIWSDNKNEIEANKVIEILKTIDLNQNIGIVTFNFKQAECIQVLLNQESINQENIHIKNIENIQGDEFDTLIFSIGYAKTPEGKLLMNFGSLANKGGEFRLNVAISRARNKIFLVSSIYAESLNVENSTNLGPKLLKNYLKYAFEVSNGHFLASMPISEFKNKESLKEILISKLNSKEIEIKEKLPFADLTILKDNRYHSLILSDDNLYYDSISSKETHGYVPNLLKKKGWKFTKYWSRNILNP